MEAIAHKSQNIKWETTVDKKRVGHKLIRRVSMDQFYALVTGEEDAFYKIAFKYIRNCTLLDVSNKASILDVSSAELRNHFILYHS